MAVSVKLKAANKPADYDGSATNVENKFKKGDEPAYDATKLKKTGQPTDK